MNKANSPGAGDHLARVSGLLRNAAGQMAEAYALLRQTGAAAEALRWEDAFAWHLEELRKAIDTCAQIEQWIRATASEEDPP